MTKTKSTKRALLTSALALLMCVSMLIGSTFAWFTDSVTSKGNTIQSGTLKVDLVDAEGNSMEGKIIEFIDQDDNDLWEPGCKYKTKPVFVVNKGNLALKYEIVINGINGDAKLLEAIEWTVNGSPIGELKGELQPNAKSGEIVLQGHMKEDAGNEYQGLTVEGISISVFATQLTSEKDSFNDQYDVNATFLNKDKAGAWIISNMDELFFFAANASNYKGQTVKLTADIDLAGYAWNAIEGFDGIFDGQNHTISNMTVSDKSAAGLFGYAKSATIKNVNIDNATVTSNHYAAAIAAHGLCTKVENCKVTNSTITTSAENINGEWDNGDKAGAIVGYLSAEPTAYVKNCTVENVTVTGYRDIGGVVGYANAPAVISGNTIKDSEIVCDPSHNYKNYSAAADFDVEAIIGEDNRTTKDENAATNVIVNVATVVGNDEALNAALADATVDFIVLESGNYGVIDVRVNRKLTIAAANGATVKLAGVNGQTNNNETDVTFKGITIDNSLQTEGWYIGTSQNMKPCVGVWGGNYTFEDCTFYVTGESKMETGVMSWWTTEVDTMTFKNCTFNGGNSSARAMQIYGHYNLTVENCTFNTAKDYSIKYVGKTGCVATFKNNNVNATTNFVQTGSAPYAGENYSLVFEGNTLATGINHVYVDNAEGQTITINGEAKAANDKAIY